MATDVASRGIDVPDLPHVVQFDLPISPDEASAAHPAARPPESDKLTYLLGGMEDSGENTGLTGAGSGRLLNDFWVRPGSTITESSELAGSGLPRDWFQLK